MMAQWRNNKVQQNRETEEEQRGIKHAKIVAALWVPKHGVFLSSVPLDSVKDTMRTQGGENAPAWAAATAKRKNIYHAEDGSAYLFESELNPKLKADAKYPNSPFIAIYGNFQKDDNPSALKPCSSVAHGAPDPPCGKVLEDLGIKH